MRSKILSGAAAGLVTAVCFGFIAQMIPMTAPNHVHGSGMYWVGQLVARIGPSVSSGRIVGTGWLFFIAYICALGLLFASFVGRQAQKSYGRATALGMIYGLFWWMIDGLLLLPLAVSEPWFATLTSGALRPYGLLSLAGHLAAGLVLGAVYCAVRNAKVMPIEREFARASNRVE